MKTYEKIYKIVKKIPRGKVATYGQVGQILDLNPRVVGWALNRLAKYRPTSLLHRPLERVPRNDVNVPWQRVINSKGTISTNRLMNIPLGLQKKLLEIEGIKFNKQDKVDFRNYLWRER